MTRLEIFGSRFQLRAEVGGRCRHRPKPEEAVKLEALMIRLREERAEMKKGWICDEWKRIL